MTHIDNTAVVEFAIGFEHRYQNGILAVFLLAVGIQFGKEIFVLMLGGGLIVLVLHLKHDRDILYPIFGLVPEDEIAFRTLNDLVVFLEIRIGHQRAQQLVKERGTMDLQALAYHLRAHAQFHIFVVRNLVLSRFQPGIHLRLHLRQLLFFLHICLGGLLPNLSDR